MNQFTTLLKNSSVKQNSTHTRMPDKALNIYGGSFAFDDEDEFYNQLYNYIFVQGNKEYLTEKQHKSGTFAIDLDFRYCADVKTRPYQINNNRNNDFDKIDDIVFIILDVMKKVCNIGETKFKCYTMLKPHVNCLEDGSKTKDGMHFIFTVQMDKNLKNIIRSECIKQFEKMIDLPLINDWESVFDAGIVNETINWTVYGCQKPANEAYEVVRVYDCELDQTDNEWITNTTYNPIIGLEEFKDLSVRKERPILESNSAYINKLSRTKSPTSVVDIHNVAENVNKKIALCEDDIYYKYLNCIGNKMCDRGHHDKTIRILQILKNENLDVKYVDYWIYRYAYPDSKKYTYAREHYLKYIHFTPITNEKRLTLKSLKMYARECNPELYSTYFKDDYEFRIKKKYSTLESLPATNSYNEAEFMNLYYEFKKERIHYKNEDIYLYYNDEWNIISDKGRMVKNDMYEFYVIYFKVWMDILNEEDKKYLNSDDSEKKEYLKKMRKLVTEVSQNYSRNCNLCNVYALLLNKLSCVKCDIEFDIGTDNLYNIHFKNGVYDMKQKIFRSRIETDYITKYLNYNYIAEDQIPQEIHDDVIGYFNRVQPNKDQCNFTLGYLAYGITGDTTKQIFKMNIGHTASNGKSTELSIHEKCFDIYTVKMDNRVLLNGFEKRHKHLIDLVKNPIRLVYFEEMPKGKKLDVNFIKDFVDGKKISCEIMHGTNDKIKIQAKLMSISNHDFQCDTDEGILRRGRVQKYESKFISKEDGVINPEMHIYEKIEGFENRFDNELYKNAYFHLLLKYVDKLVIPTSNKEEFKKTAEESDTILNNINEYFVITGNPSDKISREEIDKLCNGKEEFNEYKAKLQSKGCKYDSINRHNSTKKGLFMGIRCRTEEEKV